MIVKRILALLAVTLVSMVAQADYYQITFPPDMARGVYAEHYIPTWSNDSNGGSAFSPWWVTSATIYGRDQTPRGRVWGRLCYDSRQSTAMNCGAWRSTGIVETGAFALFLPTPLYSYSGDGMFVQTFIDNSGSGSFVDAVVISWTVP